MDKEIVFNKGMVTSCSISFGKSDPNEVDFGKPYGVPGCAVSQLFADPEQGTRARFLVLFMCHSERMNSRSLSFRLASGRSCVRKESHLLHKKVDCKQDRWVEGTGAGGSGHGISHKYPR